MTKLAGLTLLIALLSVSVARADARVRVSYLITQYGGYVFPATDNAKVDNLGLTLGRDFGAAGKSSRVAFLGGELGLETPIGTSSYLQVSSRVSETSLRLSPASAEQSGVEALASLGLGFWAPITESWRAGLEAGIRGRKWLLEGGPLPSSGHGGFTVAARIESEKWEGLFELGAMAIGLGTPSELGVQRDASTLRARVGYFADSPRSGFSPFLEFFHTHRDFFATTLVANEPALFVDEAKLVLGLGWIL